MVKPYITVQLAPCGCWTALAPEITRASIHYAVPPACPNCDKSTERIKMILRAENREE